MNGKVFLIGAGPGDPGLLTLNGKRALALSDVVIYDALVNEDILSHAPARSKKIFAGKQAHLHGKHAPRKHSSGIQAGINRMMVRFARQGLIVARLKGGDPFLFGRGGEEASYLARHSIDYEVVPGVSSLSAVPAYAGIPVTDRRHNSMLTVVTGHSAEDHYSGPQVRWDKIPEDGTLVILMGAGRIRDIAAQLMKAGWPRSVPAACIRWGTLPNQTVITGSLGNIAQKAMSQGQRFGPPVVIVIGNVVRMRKLLCR